MTQFGTPTSDIITVDWTATPYFSKLDEETSGDGVTISNESPGVGEVFVVGLKTITDPGAGLDSDSAWQFKGKAAKEGGGGANYDFPLELRTAYVSEAAQGTLHQTITLVNKSDTTLEEFSAAIAAATVVALRAAGFDDIQIRGWAVKNGGGGPRTCVFDYCRFEAPDAVAPLLVSIAGSSTPVGAWAAEVFVPPPIDVATAGSSQPVGSWTGELFKVDAPPTSGSSQPVGAWVGELFKVDAPPTSGSSEPVGSWLGELFKVDAPPTSGSSLPVGAWAAEVFVPAPLPVSISGSSQPVGSWAAEVLLPLPVSITGSSEPVGVWVGELWKVDAPPTSGSSTPGVRELDLPGEPGDYASTPDSPALSITGDIDLRVKLAMDAWTPAALSAVISKMLATGDQRAYTFRVRADGLLNFEWYFPTGAGGDAVAESSTVAPGFSNGTIHWIRVTLDVDNDALGYDLKFYTSSDGETWAQLGSTKTGGATTGIFDSSALLQISGINNGGAQHLAAEVYRAQVYDGLGGTIAFDARFNAEPIGTTSFQESSDNGATVTVNQSGSPQAEIIAGPSGWTAEVLVPLDAPPTSGSSQPVGSWAAQIFTPPPINIPTSGSSQPVGVWGVSVELFKIDAPPTSGSSLPVGIWAAVLGPIPPPPVQRRLTRLHRLRGYLT